MKLLAIGLATLAFVGLVWWLARPATEVRPAPEVELEPAAEPSAEVATTKVPPDLVHERLLEGVSLEGFSNDVVEPLTVALLAVEGPSSQAATIPGVEITIGVGREPATPLSPIQEARTIASVVTDADGRAVAEILGVIAFANEVVWAHVTTPGYQQIPAWKRPGGHELSLQVVTRKGGTVRGVVENELGERVAGARVTLFADHPHDAGEVIAVDELPSGEDGAFALHFFNPGPHHVQAAARGAGSGSLRDLDLTGPDLPQDLVVVVRGAGILAGVVRDPSGAPVQAFDLYVVPADLGRLPGPRDRQANEWSDGLFADRTSTDEEGRFRSAGLKPGAYVFMGSTLPAYPPAQLHEEPFVTDDRNIELLVGRHRVELSVYDDSGERIALGADVLHRPQLSLDRLRAFAQESDGKGRPLESRRFATPVPDVAADGTVVFTVHPERHYLIGAVGPGRFAASEVFIPYSRHLTRHELRLPPAREPAELHVRVFRPDGEPLQGSNQIYVHDSTSGRLVSRSLIPHQAPEFTTFVPPGRYAVRAEAEPEPTHMPSSAVAGYAPDETTVELLSGKRSEVELTLRGSGRLEITLDLPAPELHPSFWERDEIRSYWNLAERMQSVFQAALGGRTVALFPNAGGSDLRPLFAVRFPAESPLPKMHARWVVPQSAALSITPIAPGAYRLVVEGLAERTVTIRDGETTSVTLR